MKENEKKIDSFGQAIAAWADANHVLVKINGLPVCRTYPSSAGFEKVVWGQPRMQPPVELRNNFQKAILQGSCKEKELEIFFLGLGKKSTGELKEFSEKKFKEGMSCLGKVEFKKLSFSSD